MQYENKNYINPYSAKPIVRKFYAIILTILLLASTACELKLSQYGDDTKSTLIEVQRYDRLESRYLTTGDFSALQQMNIDYAKETRMLIENVLRIGEVNDPEINSKFLKFYQDTILQTIIADVETQYVNMDDINQQLSDAFARLQKELPDLTLPKVYAQIGALDQSIIIGENSIGISLDKYLGADYHIYSNYYPKEQRQMMNRSAIVPDCLSFYLLSLYPLQNYATSTQMQRDKHMGKVMWAVNKLMKRKVFNTQYTKEVEALAKRHPHLAVTDILASDNIK